MAIQWFPGHMHKARQEMAKVLPEIDVLIEVLDARLPYSSQNPMLATLRGSKPSLKILAKADLADPAANDIWIQELSSDATRVIAMANSDSDVQASDIAEVLPHLKSLVGGHVTRIKPRQVLVVGIPNVGKSTLINRLRGKTVARTGNEPAITKRQQPIALGKGWILRDTPGVLWPNVENPASGFRLAAAGSVRDTAMDSADVAVTLLDYLCVHYGAQLTARYAVDLPLHDSTATLEAIGRLRGCLGGGGLVDYDRAARLLLTEFRAGHIGRITLETPAMAEQENIEVLAQRERLEEKRADRKAQRKKRRARR